jgi:hypothetical protein
MATRQVQVQIVNIPRLVGMAFLALAVCGLMGVLWWFAATTTVTAVRWLVWVVSGVEAESRALWSVPIVFSIVEVVKWYYRAVAEAYPAVFRVGQAVEYFDWVSTTWGMILVLGAGTVRVLEIDLVWWHYLIILMVSVFLGKYATFTPERVSVDSVRAIIAEVAHFRSAT